MTDLQLQEIAVLLDVSIALLIFSVGLRLSISDRPTYLRRVREHYSRITRYFLLAPAVYLTLGVIWLGLLYLIYTYPISQCSPSTARPNLFCAWRDWSLFLSDRISLGMIGGGFILTIGLLVISETYDFQWIIKRFERDLLGLSVSSRLRKIAANISPEWRLDRSSRIAMLGVLGVNSFTQEDKAEVLRTLERIAYPFNSNTDIEEIQHFVDAVLASSESANLANYLLCITILSNLAVKINQDKHNNQIPTIVAGLMQLNVKQSRFDTNEIYQRLLAAFQSLELFDPCQILCAEAISRRQYKSAIGFIQYLDQATYAIQNVKDQSNSADGDLNPIIHYIGTVANAMSVGGEFSEWSKERLFTTFGDKRPELIQWCNHAIDYYRDQRADFDTATQIRREIISIL